MNEPRENAKRDEEAIAALLRFAGPRPTVSRDRAERVRGRVQDEWRQMLEDRKPRRKSWLRPAAGGFAVAAGLLLAVGLYLRLQPSLPGPAFVLTVEQVKGSVLHERDSATASVAVADTLESGTIVTTAESRVALRLPQGQSLRIDEASRLRLLDGGQFFVEAGAVYVDAAPDIAHDPLTVMTPFGVARDLGTQFEVRVLPAGMRVRVREGLVTLTHPDLKAGAIDARAGEGIALQADGSLSSERIPLHGEIWQWTTQITPQFELEGATLAAFLDWVSREQGWRLRYASLAARNAAAAQVLHGDIEDLTPEEALAAVTLAAGFTFALENGELTVARRDQPR